MKVAFVNRMLGLNRGGGEIWDLEIAEKLSDMGIDVTFYVGKPLGKDTKNPVTEFDCVEVTTPHLFDLAFSAPRGIAGVLAEVDAYFFTKRVAKKIENSDTDYDIVHINTLPQFANYVSEFDQPVVIKLNGPPHWIWYDVIRPFTSSYELLELFDAVITTGITTQKVKERTSIDVTEINPGVDTEEFEPVGLNKSEDSTEEVTGVLLFVGRFVSSKNISLLIDAFKKLQNKYEDVELILVGDGPLREKLEKKVLELKLGDSVEFVGYVDNKDLPEFYRQSDIFVLSSRNENHPITILEAMSCGTPVVAPSIGWIPNLVDDGENGLLYEEGSREELVRSIDRLLSNPDVIDDMSEKCRNKAVNEFDWGERAEKLKRVYEEL